jgi:UDP-N-acetylmuramoylalanine-D-glutamate ligase
MLWKLENFTFDVGILLNIAPDHIDRHGSMREYLQAKVNILINSKVAITNAEIKENILKDQMRGISLLHRLRPFALQNSPHRWLVYSVLTDFTNPLFL